ncbi:hypothetical protein AgCh_020413 [Apium graveolens]
MTKAVPVVSNYQSSDKERLSTGQMLISSLHEVQVDINFQPSFEKLASEGCYLNTEPNAIPNLKQPGSNNYSGKRKNRLCGKTQRARELVDNLPYTPAGNTSRSDCSQTSGDFNNVEDYDNSDIDCISSGDCDDVDVHELDNTVTKWSEYLDLGDPDRIC